MYVMRAPPYWHVGCGAEDEVPEASLWQLEVVVAEEARDFLERLDDRRLELMYRRVIDAISRLAEEPDRRQLGRGEQRSAVGHANPGAKTRCVRLVHQGSRPGRRRGEPRAGELAHARKHLPHDGAISFSVLRRGERPTLNERLATELHDCVHAAGIIVPGAKRRTVGRSARLGVVDTVARGLRCR